MPFHIIFLAAIVIGAVLVFAAIAIFRTRSPDPIAERGFREYLAFENKMAAIQKERQSLFDENLQEFQALLQGGRVPGFDAGFDAIMARFVAILDSDRPRGEPPRAVNDPAGKDDATVEPPAACRYRAQRVPGAWVAVPKPPTDDLADVKKAWARPAQEASR